ncbi:arylesterase [Runella slithyformis]|uniref:Lipolytic protein G-D-S-L family n=1 Tax=Runella slithyformis (strain ATCC 29530 / DSM 19594 / LMG 11500 / NCIMB 11436 / LSU 4) TaxID=761193 RepID=A0A7U3ZQY6_RUNSL|nr:arylesterase [Runella slithyformis]AEI51752.1 lipolytic protein G-D-S-L family [Runella slithyformis DSM 19594]
MPKIVSIFLLYFLMVMFVACTNDQKASTEKTDTPKSSTATPVKTAKNILIFGNSLTAGYGLEPAESYPAQLQNRLDSLNLPYKIINAGVSGETTSGGNSRLDWVLKNPVDIFILELGGNDGLRGIPATETRKNLQSMIDKVKAKYPDAKIILAGMQVPPSMGKKYADEFRVIYPELAEKNNVELIPFLLENVGGEVKLNQKDGIHPNAVGAKIVAENVWKVLEGMLEKPA